LLRVGRTNERSGENDPSFATRSAEVFTQVALALNFSIGLVESIAACIGEFAPIMSEYFAQKIPYVGFSGKIEEQLAKARLVKGILDLSHNMDLVRVWGNLKRIGEATKGDLKGLIESNQIDRIQKISLDFSRASCDATGTLYYLHNSSRDLKQTPGYLKGIAVNKVAATLLFLDKLLTFIIAEIDHFRKCLTY